MIYTLAVFGCGILVGLPLGVWYALREVDRRDQERMRLRERYGG